MGGVMCKTPDRTTQKPQFIVDGMEKMRKTAKKASPLKTGMKTGHICIIIAVDFIGAYQRTIVRDYALVIY